ncbi:MAG: hypothetical protein ACO1OX_14540 [Novosphingobium sp.]
MMRFVWFAILALIACIATGAELDRASRRQPSLVAFVPQPFRSFAQENLTMANVRSADPKLALEETQALVWRSPMPAEHLTLLAIAKERNGERDASARLVQRAAQRGWRDPIAQQAMFDIALAAGDPVEAAHRFAALWALKEDQAPLADMEQRLLATPEGRSALADTLVGGGNWTKAYLRSVAAKPGDDSAASIALALRKGGRFDCGAVSQLRPALAKRGFQAEASLLDNCIRMKR